MPSYEYEIGASFGSMANVESLSVPLPAPRHTWRSDMQRINLASLGQRGTGPPMVTWSWGFLTTAQRNYLRTTFCPDPQADADIYIKTKTDDETYTVFTGKMIWPEEEDKRAGRVLEFSVRFEGLEAYP